MSALDRLVPTPRLVEVDHVDVDAPPAVVWERVRHGDLGRSALVRALFAIRELPAMLTHRERPSFSLRIDDFAAPSDKPGFRVLVDDPPRELAVGAIGKVWQPDILFVEVARADEFAAFGLPDFAKVAWAVRIAPRGDAGARVELEVRVDATDEDAWQKFRSYFRLIGPGSRFIRHSVLADLASEFGKPAAHERERPLDGDDLLPDARGQLTHAIDIAAPPAAIWPWLLQMGCGRAGFYSIDLFDNAGVRSAREVHPELAALAVGDVIAATPDGSDGFEVLRIAHERTLVLGGLYDVDGKRQLRFAAPRPPRYWQVSWAFVLEPLDAHTTRLHARARGAFSPSERLHAAWIRPVHWLMQTAQLRHLAARAEGRLAKDDWHDVLEGVGGAGLIALALLTPFLRGARTHWGLEPKLAARALPGDALVAEPRWGWTHGIEVAAPAAEVWRWVAQIGADRAGFYSYQWLENLAGCELRNAETVHPEWQHRAGDAFYLHPKMPPMTVVELSPGRHFVAHAGDPDARAAGRPWVEASWLFLVEPLGIDRCRFVSRYRAASSDDLATRLSFGPALNEPIGFAMDRRMLLGVKARAERDAHPPRLRDHDGDAVGVDGRLIHA
ncbi:MAG TPA: hypothetical protein VF945_16250 [Polyangia bacterium]